MKIKDGVSLGKILEMLGIDKSNIDKELRSYVVVSRKEFKRIESFKRQNKKAVDKKTEKLIRARYSELNSQRSVAKEFKVSLATVNRILNDKY